MGKALLVIIVVVLAVYSLFDVVATPRTSIRSLPKALWFVVVLVPVLGAILWLLFGKVRTRPAGPPRAPRPPSRGPDDDPEFLRGL
ncbi:PLDc N-terminal domain-containing protein [Solicola sp. PLA-1-18]|uniref:PLDc N-terminal domain-containing protein n=1 Tax=Solicola sp. PLA-1-18 TaxID=3380532 RepID=UPI003B7AD5A3